MTTALTVGAPASQASASTAGGRTSARRGSEKPSGGVGGFDAVMADHAALPKPPRQTRVKPSPEAQTRGADKRGASLSSHRPMTGSALKAPRADPGRRDDSAKDTAAEPVSLGAGESADRITAPVTAASTPDGVDPAGPIQAPVTAASTPAGVDPAGPIAAPGIPPSVTTAPTAGGSGVAPVLSPGRATGVVVVADPTSSYPQQVAAAEAMGAPAAAFSGVTPEPNTPAPATSSTIPAEPTLSQGAGSAGPAGVVAGGAAAVVPGTGSVAPADPRVALGQPAEPGVAADPAHPIAAAVSASVARTPLAPGLDVVPAPSTPAAPATTSTTLGAQPEAAAPILAQGKGSADLAAATTSAAPPADGAVRGIPGSTGQSGPEATTVFPVALDPVSVDQVSSGGPVVVATASSSSQPQQGAEGTGEGGAPTAPAPGVVPVLTGLVPPAAVSTASAAPAMGQPALFPLPTAHQQVLTAVSPLLRGADGNYAIELQLHPKDLGVVQVSVDIRRGEISIQMHAPDAAARDALRSGLSDLRAQLEDQGLRAGSMEVGSGGANARQPQTSWPRSEGIDAPERSPFPPDPLVAPATGASSNSLDLRM